MKAIYEIEIKSPKKAMTDPYGGHASSSVKKVNAAGDAVDLSVAEQIRYEGIRKVYNFTDLDFQLFIKGENQLTFKIANGSKWQFRSTPIKFDHQPSGVKIVRDGSDPKHAIVTFPAKGPGEWDTYKYTLYYEKVGDPESIFEHDPIINDGDDPETDP